MCGKAGAILPDRKPRVIEPINSYNLRAAFIDGDFIDRIKRHMRRHYSRGDIAAAKFIVRSVADY